MKFNYHITKEVKQQLQHIEENKFQNDNALEQLNTLISSLLEWSGKQNYNIIFDSDLDGDGIGIIEYKVINKKNLYFISFDDKNNVFGVYVDTIINTPNDYITDPNSFTFSLIRNGNKRKINIKSRKVK